MIRLAPVPSLVEEQSTYRFQEEGAVAIAGVLVFSAKKFARAWALITRCTSKVRSY